jgi:RNA polymerase sigma factor (sigma-70 family)
MTAVTNVDNLEPLVAAATGGDADAFGRIIGATSGLVASIALAIVRDVDLSQEIAQDVFLSAWRDLTKLRNPASFLPWLRQMTRNRAHHVLRGRLRGRRWMVQLADEGEAEAIPDSRAGASERLLANEQREMLRAAFATLPEETREVLTLYYREGRSAAQVASLLELSEEAVKKRLSRARAALRDTMLERLGDTLGRTAPGAAFTVAVMTALPLTAPVTVSAAAAGTVKAASAAGATSGGMWAWIAWLFAPIAAFLLSAGGGVLGVVWGGRVALRQARDERERRELRRFTLTNIAAVLAVTAVFQLDTGVFRGAWVRIVAFSVFNVVLMWLHLRWLPRIVARRFAAELREQPERARARRRRERLYRIAGWAASLGVGWVVLFYTLLRTDRL